MADYTDYQKVIDYLKDAQAADKDRRDQVRLEREFLLPIEGAQWDQEWWNQSAGKPRYEFDITSPVVDNIAGEIEQADFSIKIDPLGGQASMELADHLDGMVRNIQAMSNAEDTYNRSSRLVVIGGMDGWEVTQEYVSADSFDQDLMIRPIHNYLDRVWFDHASEEQDGSDARHVFKLTAVAKDIYEERYSDGSGQSVDEDRTTNSLYQSKDVVVCGEIYYIKKTDRTLVLMTNGNTYDKDSDAFKAVQDELAQQGVTVKGERKRPQARVYRRKFDGKGWLGKEQETVFSMLPIIPMYANYEVYNNVRMYRGEVCKLMHPQKVFNYSTSREVEEGALAPRAKIFMDKRHTNGDPDIMKSLETMNTNNEPVQFVYMDPELPNPYMLGGAQINPGLTTLSQSMKETILSISGQFAPAMGDNPGLQSGVAIEKLQNKSDTGTVKYIRAREIAQNRTGRVLIDAIPRVYDTARQVDVVGEDGSRETITINQPIFDNQTRTWKEPIDFSKGIYDVTCSAGEAFRNRQDKTVDTLERLGQIVPGLIEENGDILLNNVSAPGMDDAAARYRQKLLKAGVVPEDQMTEDEIAQLQQAAQQQQEPDAMMVAAQAEMGKAQAAMEQARIKEMEANAKIQAQMLKVQEAQHKLETEQFKIMMQREKEQHQMQMDQVKAAYTQAQTEGQRIDNAISMEQLRQMPTEELMRVAEGQQRLSVVQGGKADFMFDKNSRRIRANR